ncbi:alpha/beta hydrolase fold containing protein [Enterobacter cancerogenus]|uniref:Alpha/beta hydrolase fold containing protein n=1 Tax=Enterobacter cancerogenus TaxID=69218 RepID=A0A484X2J6_9ENTR|nr:alpha/beta hydrolase fold containing protein [Enterobacter cancerogenus]
MKLNTRAQSAQSPNNNSPIVLVHGLFGSLDNLGILARDLVADHDILQVDMRNHGLSGRSPDMTYAAMAQDLLDTLDAHQLEKVTLVGHSMGGKAVMALTALAPERIAGLVVVDVAPVDYDVRRHDEIFAAINAVTESGVSTRQQAAAVMREHLDEEGVVQFLLKSFVDGQWRFNVPVLWDQYTHIVGWQPVPAWQHPCPLYYRRQFTLRDRGVPQRSAGAVPTGSRARHRRGGPLGSCRKTGGGPARYPPLSY